jgi:hypothetical protein
MYRPKFNYRRNAPAGSRRRALDAFNCYDSWGPKPPAGRLLRLSSTPLGVKHDKNPENLSNVRTLKRLPGSISENAVD